MEPMKELGRDKQSVGNDAVKSDPYNKWLVLSYLVSRLCAAMKVSNQVLDSTNPDSMRIMIERRAEKVSSALHEYPHSSSSSIRERTSNNRVVLWVVVCTCCMGENARGGRAGDVGGDPGGGTS